MKTMLHSVIATVLIVAASVSQAAEDPYKNLRGMVSKNFPGVEISGFKDTDIPNIIEFNLGAQVLYASKDGRFLFQGDIYDLIKQVNLTEQSEQISRVSALKKLGEDNMLVYKPENQKRFVTVFTDIDCPYCRRLHEEVDQYLKKGIGVRYLFLPFKGKKSFDKSVSVWCAKDPQASMTKAKEGRRVRNATCDHPLTKHMALGKDFGIRGTPAIVLDNGEMVPGYRPVNDIEKMLNGEEIKGRR